MIITALLLGFYMAWNIGANDVANAMGTSVGSKALSLKRAIILAAVLEFAGAFFIGSNVSETIQGGIIDPSFFEADPVIFALGMMGSLLATGALLQIASYFGLPISTTHAIVGAVTGFGVVIGGFDAIYWGKLGWIAASWVLSPILSGIFSFAIFRFIQKNILQSRVFASGIQGRLFDGLEKPFIPLQILSACLVAFAHGSNDIANAIGPVSAVIHTLQNHSVQNMHAIPAWLLAFGGCGIVVGLATWGWRVIETIGEKITELTPARGFSAEFGAAITILFASKLGLPISTTHALIGSVLGVGMARGVEAINLQTIKEISISWVVTIPLCALFSILSFYFLRLCFI